MPSMGRRGEHRQGSLFLCLQDTECPGLYEVSRIVWGWKDFCPSPTPQQLKYLLPWQHSRGAPVHLHAHSRAPLPVLEETLCYFMGFVNSDTVISVTLFWF